MDCRILQVNAGFHKVPGRTMGYRVLLGGTGGTEGTGGIGCTRDTGGNGGFLGPLRVFQGTAGYFWVMQDTDGYCSTTQSCQILLGSVQEYWGMGLKYCRALHGTKGIAE